MGLPLNPLERLVCFQDKTRVCGPDCMAYITPPPDPIYRDQQWAHCILLVNANRVGTHMVLLAQHTGQQVQKAKTASADAARSNQPPPPAVK